MPQPKKLGFFLEIVLFMKTNFKMNWNRKSLASKTLQANDKGMRMLYFTWGLYWS
jgi:hypothetical protein